MDNTVILCATRGFFRLSYFQNSVLYFAVGYVEQGAEVADRNFITDARARSGSAHGGFLRIAAGHLPGAMCAVHQPKYGQYFIA